MPFDFITEMFEASTACEFIEQWQLTERIHFKNEHVSSGFGEKKISTLFFQWKISQLRFFFSLLHIYHFILYSLYLSTVIKYCVVALMRIIWMSKSITNREKLLPPANTFSYYSKCHLMRMQLILDMNLPLMIHLWNSVYRSFVRPTPNI